MQSLLSQIAEEARRTGESDESLLDRLFEDLREPINLSRLAKEVEALARAEKLSMVPDGMESEVPHLAFEEKLHAAIAKKLGTNLASLHGKKAEITQRLPIELLHGVADRV